MNKEFKRFNSLPIQTQNDICEILLFNEIGSKDSSEIELMYMWLEEINPLVYTLLCANGFYKCVKTFGCDTMKIKNKVTQYLCFVCEEIHTL